MEINGRIEIRTNVKNHPVQQIMSRTGSFPLHVVSALLEEHAPSSSKVLDPFCGKGTTLLASRLLGHRAYGLDVSPEAVACSRAKMQSVEVGALTDYIQGIRLGRPSIQNTPSSVKAYFSDQTLTEIISVRNHLLRDLDSGDKKIVSNATFTLALLLGILHGHASYSLSIPSSHAFAMAPDYVRKYAYAHDLEAPSKDVKQCLIAKLERCLRTPLPPPIHYSVKLGTASECVSLFRHLRGEVDIVLTSPPYLNAQTYAKDNWLRLWLLGYDYKILQSRYIQTGSIRNYEKKMTEVLHQISRLLKTYGILILIAGTVNKTVKTKEGSNKISINTGLILADIIRESSELDLELISCEEHQVSSECRYYHSLSRTNGHSRRDLVETTVIAQKRG